MSFRGGRGGGRSFGGGRGGRGGRSPGGRGGRGGGGRFGREEGPPAEVLGTPIYILSLDQCAVRFRRAMLSPCFYYLGDSMIFICGNF